MEFRFSPIKSKEELLAAIQYLHIECAKLCKQAFGRYLPVAGNIGVFSHFDDEFRFLTGVRQELTDVKGNWNAKYYRLHEPIMIEANGGIPQATYTYLYTRRPDADKPEVGDIDFVIATEEFSTLKAAASQADSEINGVQVSYRPDLNMVCLSHPDSDVLPYITDTYLSQRSL